MKILSGLIGSILSLLGGIFLLIAAGKAIVNISQMPLAQLIVLGVTAYAMGKVLEIIASEKVIEAKEVE